MASLMDCLITISGQDGTANEIKACINAGTPVMPVWTSGGASLDHWNEIISKRNEEIVPYIFYKGLGFFDKIENLNSLTSHRNS